MVVKKYLCAAPRPDSWEAKAEALLKSLNGDKARREQFARRTLDLLRERRKPEKKRAGPGRKSNAEHAIAFYEYLVGFDDKNHDTNSDDENSDDENSTGTDQTLDTQEFLNQHDNVCDVCNLGGELVCCSTCTLAFHQDCMRPVVRTIPSDWSCPHCITQGVKNYKRHSKTWKAAASGIRQMNRMKQEKQKGGVQQGDDRQEGAKEEGKTIKTGQNDSETADETKAAEGESSSSTKKNDNENDNETGEKRTDEGENSEKESSKESHRKRNAKERSKAKPTVAGTGSISAASSVSSTGESRRNLALYKIADSYTPDCTENLLVRGRRQRKQPTLYQPQLCADSRWKSDEKHHRSNDSYDSTNTDNEIDSDVNSSSKEKGDAKSNRNAKQSAKPQRTKGAENEIENNVIVCVGPTEGEKKSDHPPFCNFCRDDPAIPICVFCGCRICFGKHDKTTLLLCDRCDDEYHTRCLGLTTVPVSQKWYCPDCDQTRNAETTTKVLSTRRASYGAKASNSDTDAEENTRRNTTSKKSRTATKTSTPATTKSTQVETSGRRSRGRPPKTKVEKEVPPVPQISPRKRVKTPKAAAISSEATEQQQQQQRKRGRPPKSSTIVPSSSSAGSAPSSGRKRGRPPKSAAITETPSAPSKATPTPRKRGRPPKATPEPVAISSKVDSAAKKKVSKPTAPSSSTASVKTASSSAASEVAGKPQEPVKVVSRVSGRTVKRATFHDEVDEGEQHLRASKPTPSAESQSTNNTSKTAVSKSQESQSHDHGQKDVSNKLPEPSEPARKKQKVDASEPTRKKQKADTAEPTRKKQKADTTESTRKKQKADATEPTRKKQKVVATEPTRKKQNVEEKLPSQSKVATKSSDSKSTKTTVPPKKDDEEIPDAPPLVPVRMKPVLDPPAPPIAPVRMKPVLDPPAPPIAPVRMKPVLEPPAPAIRPPIAVAKKPAPTGKIEKQEASTNDSKAVTKAAVADEAKKDSKTEDAAPASTKPEGTKKPESQSRASVPPATIPTKIAATAVATSKAATGATATNATATAVAASKAENATVSTNSTTNTNANANAVPKQTPTLSNEPPSSASKSTANTQAVPNYPSIHLLDPVALEAAIKALPEPEDKGPKTGTTKIPRRKPGARECMQISRRFGVNIIPEKYMRTLLDYCRRGKVEHLIKMRERLDCHSRFLESQLAGLEARIKEVGESKVVVPALPPHKRESSGRQRGGGTSPTPPLSAYKRPPTAMPSAALGTAIGKAHVPPNPPGRMPPVVAPQVLSTNTAAIAAKAASIGPKVALAIKPNATVSVAPVTYAAAPRPAVAPATTPSNATKMA